MKKKYQNDLLGWSKEEIKKEWNNVWESMKNYKVNLQNGFVVKANNEEDAVKWVFQTLILYGGYDVEEYPDGDVKDDGEKIPIVYDFDDFYDTVEV